MMFKHNPTIKYSKMYNENIDECDSTLFLQSNPTETRTNHCLSNTEPVFEAELLLLDILRYLPLYVAFPNICKQHYYKKCKFTSQNARGVTRSCQNAPSSAKHDGIQSSLNTCQK